MTEDKKSPSVIAAENWARYEYGISRGHREYTETAKMLEGFYLGGGYDKDGNLLPGGQWNEADLDVLNAEGRPAYEFNQLKPALDAAFGYQISNRMDISFRPRSGDATKDLAEVRSKVAMQIADNNKLHWKESEVFEDGMIQQRGYFNCRIDFDDDFEGELRVDVEDPMDVIPDPDAKGYDPATWSDVIVTRWLTFDQIELLYGAKARKEAEDNTSNQDTEFGDSADGARRNSFATTLNYDSKYTDAKITRVRVIDRQHFIRTQMDVTVSQGGDVRQLTGDDIQHQIATAQSQGLFVTKKMSNRVRWTVSTCDTLLFDEWSPYDRITIIPYFPYFRRGQTRGMIDNGVGPQKALNKGVSQATHIINTTANSGWQLEEDQLTNMTTNDLSAFGSSTGLVLERKKGSAPLIKITSNNMPQGIAEIIGMSVKAIQDVTVPDAMRGLAEGGDSGIAIQSKQHASQQILAVPLDNLSRTRHMLAEWHDYAISKYYTTEKIYRITKTDPMTGKETEEPLTINQFDGFSYINDMTSGEYDVVVTSQPMQVTFDNSQFNQAIEMRREGVRLPDAFVIKNSNLADKEEAIAQMQDSQPPSDPTLEAKAALISAQTELAKAQTELAKATAVNKNVEATFSGTTASRLIAETPQLAGMTDQLLKSAGFEDKDAAPIMPENIQSVVGEPPLPQNTNPLTPVNPDVGMNEGMEGGDMNGRNGSVEFSQTDAE